MEALHSGLMRIPRFRTEVARDLLDLGIREIYQLRGRSPEALLDDLRRLRPPAPDRLRWFRLAVYFAETESPERALLTPEAWAD